MNVRQDVYTIPRALVSTMVDVEKLVPNGIVCLYNAWAFYKLSIAIPPAICIAIETKRKVSIPKGIYVQHYYWKKVHLALGIAEQKYSGYIVKMTGLERSVCDAIKY